MYFDPKTNNFYLENNKIFDASTLEWKIIQNLPQGLEECSIQEAVKKLQNTENRIKLPIGVIGTGSPNKEQYKIAEDLGKSLAELGLKVICGGRAGIMEAVCKGVSENNGISIGILPESSTENANKYVTIPLATGIGFARNALICSSSYCLIAIGGGNGTLCEIAYGLQFKKPVFSIKCTLAVDGLVSCNSISEIIHKISNLIFNIDYTEEKLNDI